MIQNDTTYQSWLKTADGNLLQRLTAIEEPEQLAGQLYLSILCRTPDAEELELVARLLQENSSDRASIIQELVWGLLSSSEFRFAM